MKPPPCKCERPTPDETGRCFECDGEVTPDYLPSWLRELAADCPAEEQCQNPACAKWDANGVFHDCVWPDCLGAKSLTISLTSSPGAPILYSLLREIDEMKVNNIAGAGLLTERQKRSVRGSGLRHFFYIAKASGVSNIDCTAEMYDEKRVKVVFETKDARNRNGNHTVIVGPMGGIIVATTDNPQ